MTLLVTNLAPFDSETIDASGRQPVGEVQA